MWVTDGSESFIFSIPFWERKPGFHFDYHILILTTLEFPLVGVAQMCINKTLVFLSHPGI